MLCKDQFLVQGHTQITHSSLKGNTWETMPQTRQIDFKDLLESTKPDELDFSVVLPEAVGRHSGTELSPPMSEEFSLPRR